jgi:hypothetical protein
MEEIWKQVTDPRYDYIEVSNLGRLRKISNGHMYKFSFNHRGYHWVRLRSKFNMKERKFIKMHRLVAMAFIPNHRDPEIYNQVNHKDGIKTNNRVDNLEWMSCAENIRHAWATGIRKRKSDLNKI